ncbi:MAG: hypothetical protein R3C46_15605 [Hyphomonadaceae bacterium]
MIKFAVAGCALLASACAMGPTDPGPRSLTDLEAAHDWQYEPGERLNADWVSGAQGILGPLSRPKAMDAIRAAGFACIFGEAHQDYPDPMAVCTRSFATRRCQMTWEISSTADKGMVDWVDGSFQRDCVGLEDDWPEKIRSAIDDQLAPAQPRVPPKS